MTSSTPAPGLKTPLRFDVRRGPFPIPDWAQCVVGREVGSDGRQMAGGSSPRTLAGWKWTPRSLCSEESELIDLVDDNEFRNAAASVDSQFARSVLIHRMLSDLQHHNHLWSPLANATHKAGLWQIPSEPDRAASAGIDTPSPGGSVHMRAAHQQLAAIGAWIQDQDSAGVLSQLLDFENPALVDLLAEHARVFSPGLLRTLLAYDGETRRILLQNPAVPTETKRQIIDEALDRVGSRRPVNSEDISLIRDHLNRAGRGLRASQIQRVLSLLSAPESELSGFYLDLLINPAVLDRMSPTELLTVLGHLDSPVEKGRVAKSKGADASVWVAALQSSFSAELQWTLAGHPPAASDPGVAETLSTSAHASVIERIAPFAPRACFPKIFRRLIRLDAWKALETLETRIEEMKGVLVPEDLEPFLTHSSGEIRSRALTLLSAIALPTTCRQPVASRRRP